MEYFLCKIFFFANTVELLTNMKLILMTTHHGRQILWACRHSKFIIIIKFLWESKFRTVRPVLKSTVIIYLPSSTVYFLFEKHLSVFLVCDRTFCDKNNYPPPLFVFFVIGSHTDENDVSPTFDLNKSSILYKQFLHPKCQ